MQFRILGMLTLLVFPIVAGAASWAEKMDDIFEPALQNGTFAGASVVVIADREIAFIKGYGKANDTDKAFTPATRSYLGSVSKSFVGLVLVQLAGEGKIDLDAPVQRYLPEFELADDASKITTRQLLTHTSGFSTYTGNRNQSDEDQSPDGLTRTVQELAEWSLSSEPGTQFAYSNANYQVLGRLIEVLTGKPFAAVVQERVFGPLNMSASRVMHDFSHPDSADGYRFWGPVMVSHQDPMGTGLMPQGGVSTTAEDMANYLIGLMGGNNDLPNVWDPELAQSHSLAGYGPYGAGWGVVGTGQEMILVHSGLNGGFTAVAAFKPHMGSGIAVIMNTADGYLSGDVDYLHNRALHTVFSELPDGVEVEYLFRWLNVLGMLAGLWGLLAWITSVAKKGMPTDHFVLRLIVPTALLLGLAYAVGVVLPTLFNIPLDGMKVFNPEVSYLLIATAGLALVWAAVRVVLLVSAKVTV